MNNYEAHQERIKKVGLLITENFPMSFRWFARPVGQFHAKRIDKGIINYIPYFMGKVGQCDNWGVMKCYFPGNPNLIFPIHIEMETKTGTGKLNPDQIIWRDFCHYMGWLWFEIRDEETFIRELKNKITSMGLVWTTTN